MVIHILETGDATGWLRASESQNPVQGATTCCVRTALPSSSTPPVLGAAGDTGGGRPLGPTPGGCQPRAPCPPVPVPRAHAGLPAWWLQTLIGSAWAAPLSLPCGILFILQDPARRSPSLEPSASLSSLGGGCSPSFPG